MPRNTSYIPPHADVREAKQQFGNRLRESMVRKGWSQSDLARHADLRRDAISTYIRGKVWPEPGNLKKLADALGITSQDLIPITATASAAFSTPMNPSVELVQHDGQTILKIHRAVSLEQAAAILEILK